MTEFLTANIGSLPRIGEEKDQQRHRRGLTHFQNKEISEHAFRDVEQSVTQELIRDQVETGIDEITDGLVSWLDPVRFVCSQLSGLSFLGLARYFDNNFYYRIPLITASPKRKKPIFLPHYQFAQNHSPLPVRVVMTGPYTLARHTLSDVKTFEKLPARLQLFTEILKEEIDSLAKNGAKLIQIDEPSIAKNPEDFVLFAKSLQQLTEKKPLVRFILAVSYSPLSAIYNNLASLPVDVLNLDFSYDGKKLFEKIFQNPPPMALGMGLLNARNTRLEPIDPLLHALNEWIAKKSPALCYLTPSSALEYLPHGIAMAKLKLLGKMKAELK